MKSVCFNRIIYNPKTPIDIAISDVRGFVDDRWDEEDRTSNILFSLRSTMSSISTQMFMESF